MYKRQLIAGLILGTLVELFDKLCNIYTVLTQCRANRRGSRCFCRIDLQLDITCYFLCHDKHLLNKVVDWRDALHPSHKSRNPA